MVKKDFNHKKKKKKYDLTMVHLNHERKSRSSDIDNKDNVFLSTDNRTYLFQADDETDLEA